MLVGETGWAYLAGFIDGEGCIVLRGEQPGHGYGTPVITISQTRDRGKFLLEEIQTFLATHNIPSKIYSSKRQKEHHQQAWVLYVFSRIGIRVLIKGILPYTKIKKVEAQDLLRYLILFTMPRRGISHSRLISSGMRKANVSR